MASQSLQLGEGITIVSLRRDLIAIPGFFKPRCKHGESLLSSYERLRQDKFSLVERAEIFARSLGAIGGKCTKVVEACDPRPVGAMNGHAVVAEAGRFARGEDPLLPRPQGNGRSLQGHFLPSGRAKPHAENPVGNQDGCRANADPEEDVPERLLITDVAKNAAQRV